MNYHIKTIKILAKKFEIENQLDQKKKLLKQSNIIHSKKLKKSLQVIVIDRR